MSDSTKLIKVSSARTVQISDQISFVGEQPKLPPSCPLPLCQMCGTVQSFFFQIAFEEDHAWAGHTLAVFQCTSCYDKGHIVPLIRRSLFPTMINDYLLPGEDIPDGAVDLIQVRCRFIAFRTADAVLRDEYREKVAFRKISLKPFDNEKRTTKSKVGGKPGWVAEDQSPGLYLGQPLRFLMQWQMFYEFDLVPDAPPPFDPMMEAIPELKEIRHYDLFVGKQLYFFGNFANARYHVYLFSQRD
jgi:hypothetical protein